MKALSEKVHNAGMKFGLYESAGTMTCQGLAGSMGMEWFDAQVFAEWDIDFLKVHFLKVTEVTGKNFFLAVNFLTRSFKTRNIDSLSFLCSMTTATLKTIVSFWMRLTDSLFVNLLFSDIP